MSETARVRATEAAGPGAEDDVVELAEEERELVAAQVEPWVERFDGETAERFARLAAAVREGRVTGEELLAPLGRALALALETGRARRLHGPHGEKTLKRIFRRTPAGRQLVASTRATNTALSALQGQTLEQLTFAVEGPGHYRLELGTDRCDVRIIVDGDGVRFANLGFGI